MNHNQLAMVKIALYSSGDQLYKEAGYIEQGVKWLLKALKGAEGAALKGAGKATGWQAVKGDAKGLASGAKSSGKKGLSRYWELLTGRAGGAKSPRAGKLFPEISARRAGKSITPEAASAQRLEGLKRLGTRAGTGYVAYKGAKGLFGGNKDKGTRVNVSYG